MADEPKSTKEPAGRSSGLPEFQIVGEYPPKPQVTRRGFISWAGAAWGTFAIANAAGLGICGRFMLPNVLFEAPQVFKAGKIEDFDWDAPSDRYKSSQKCVIVKLNKDWNKKPALIALDITCTHLGCTPNILQAENKIKCPCHGSGFRFDGRNFEGPAPRPLERYKVFVDAIDGLITVDKTKKFHFEKSEWTDPDCSILL